MLVPCRETKNVDGLQPAGGIQHGAGGTVIASHAWSIRELDVGCVAGEQPEASRGEHTADGHVARRSCVGSETAVPNEARQLHVTTTAGEPEAGREVRPGLLGGSLDARRDQNLRVALLDGEGQLAPLRESGSD